MLTHWRATCLLALTATEAERSVLKRIDAACEQFRTASRAGAADAVAVAIEARKLLEKCVTTLTNHKKSGSEKRKAHTPTIAVFAAHRYRNHNGRVCRIRPVPTGCSEIWQAILRNQSFGSSGPRTRWSKCVEWCLSFFSFGIYRSITATAFASGVMQNRWP